MTHTSDDTVKSLMDKVAYIDAASRLVMCASFAITGANGGDPSDYSLHSRVRQCEEYIARMKVALRTVPSSKATTDTQANHADDARDIAFPRDMKRGPDKR